MSDMSPKEKVWDFDLANIPKSSDPSVHLMNKMDDLKNENKILKDKNDKLCQDIKCLRKVNQDLNKTNQDLRKTNERYLNTCVSKNKTIDNLGLRCENLERECNRLKSELKDDAQDVDYFTSKIGKLKEENRKNKGRVAELELVVSDLEQEHNNLKLKSHPERMRRDIALKSYDAALWQTVIRSLAFCAIVYAIVGTF